MSEEPDPTLLASIRSFYSEHVPDKSATEVDELIANYKGREQRLLDKARKKYLGVPPEPALPQKQQIEETNTAASGCSVTNATDNDSALCGACLGGEMDQVQRLLAQGANPNATVKGFPGPAMFIAAAQGHKQCLALLLGIGASVNLRDKDRYTALHVAAQRGHSQVVSSLLEAGADPLALSNDHETTVWLGAYAGSTEVVRTLLGHGADPSVATRPEMAEFGGMTTFDIAKQQGHATVVVLLEQTAARSTLRWIPNQAAADCMLCHCKFGVANWRHHCRGCGWVVCAACIEGVELILDRWVDHHGQHYHNQRLRKVCKGCRAHYLAPPSPTALPGLGLPPPGVAPAPSMQVSSAEEPEPPEDFFSALEKFKPALAALGVIEVEDLAQVSDEELQSIGLSFVQLKRLRKRVPLGEFLEQVEHAEPEPEPNPPQEPAATLEPLSQGKRLGEVISDADKAKVIALKAWLATNAPSGSAHRTTAVEIFKAVATQESRADVLLAWDTLTTDKVNVEATLEELSFAVVANGLASNVKR